MLVEAHDLHWLSLTKTKQTWRKALETNTFACLHVTLQSFLCWLFADFRLFDRNKSLKYFTLFLIMFFSLGLSRLWLCLMWISKTDPI